MQRQHTLKPKYLKILLIGGGFSALGITLGIRYFTEGEESTIMLLIFSVAFLILGLYFLNNFRYKQHLTFEIKDGELLVKTQWSPASRLDDQEIAYPISEIKYLWLEQNTTANFIFFRFHVTNFLVSYKDNPASAYMIEQTGPDYFEEIPGSEIISICSEVQKINPDILLGAPAKYETVLTGIGPARKISGK